MNIGQLSLFIFLLRPHSYSTGSWPANNVYELNGYVFEVKENAVSWMLVYAARGVLKVRLKLKLAAKLGGNPRVRRTAKTGV